MSFKTEAFLRTLIIVKYIKSFIYDMRDDVIKLQGLIWKIRIVVFQQTQKQYIFYLHYKNVCSTVRKQIRKLFDVIFQTLCSNILHEKCCAKFNLQIFFSKYITFLRGILQSLNDILLRVIDRDLQNKNLVWNISTSSAITIFFS